MLINFLGAADGGLPAGMAEFTNDGKFIRRIDNPSDAPYGYDVAIKPGLNRMVSSSFTPLRNYRKPLAQMDMKDFGRELVVWDFKNRTPLQVGKAGLAPLEVRWSLKPENNYGFTNCALDNSLWMFRGQADGSYEFKKVADTGALPADLRQSPDDRYLFVSCFGDNLLQQWDVSDPDHPRLFSTVSPGVQPNMMHVTGDGKRMYVSNSLLSTLDHAGRFWVRLIHVGPDGMKVDPFFNIDLNKFPDRTGAGARHADQLAGDPAGPEAPFVLATRRAAGAAMVPASRSPAQRAGRHLPEPELATGPTRRARSNARTRRSCRAGREAALTNFTSP